MESLIPLEREILLTESQSQFVMQIEHAFTTVADTLDEHSRRIYANSIKTFLQWFFESRRELNRSTMAAYRRFLDEHYQQTTAKRMWSVVYRTLQEMVNDHMLNEHPARGIRGFKAQGNYTKHIALSKEQAKTLLNSVPDTKKGKRDRAILLTLLYTGLRRSECASLTLGQMTMAHGHHVFILKEKDTKNNEAAMVKVPVNVWRAIDEYLTETKREHVSSGAPLFAAFDRGDNPVEAPISTMVIYRTVKEYAKLANIDNLLPHGMRASFITLSIEGGAPLYKVARDARHKDSRMTEHYFKRKQDLDKSAADYIEL